MDTLLIKEVLNCLCGERTMYRYTAEQYALYLLKRLALEGDKIALRDLRNSPWSGLLNKSLMRAMVAQCGDGYLRKSALENAVFLDAEPYVLTLGEWGVGMRYGRSQTSRPGGNLVLQLNLSQAWARRFHRLVKEPANEFFGFWHPLSQSRPITLAWARLDVDFATNEVLIEEVQSDLIRNVAQMERLASHYLKGDCDTFHYYGVPIPTEAFAEFGRDFIGAFGRTWKEAVLAAALEFCFDELGVSNVFYHSYATGNEMKNIRWSKPPRSLYTKLPKQFCFTETKEAPEFLLQDKKALRKLKKIKDSRWFKLAA